MKKLIIIAALVTSTQAGAFWGFGDGLSDGFADRNLDFNMSFSEGANSLCTATAATPCTMAYAAPEYAPLAPRHRPSGPGASERR